MTEPSNPDTLVVDYEKGVHSVDSHVLHDLLIQHILLSIADHMCLTTLPFIAILPHMT